jgi:hypothetical protein
VLLQGSCQCNKVRFRVQSETPYPFMYCYCSICRKLTGAITCNVMGDRSTLVVHGEEHLKVHHAIVRRPGKRPTRSEGERWFCGECGTHLYVLDDRWPEGVWPNAAALDTPLPDPPSRVHIMLDSKPDWVPVPGRGERFAEYPKLSIADWHARHRLDGTDAAGEKSQRRGARKRRAARRAS